ncbi:MAG: biopolymer transporter ExbD [Vicinamibacteraceae bacterium]
MPGVKVHSTGGSAMGGRRGRMYHVAPSLSEINVVPLVDVMLVLLIVFMVAAPLMTRGMDVALPEARNSPVLENERVFVTIPPTFGEERQVEINDKLVRIEVFEERVRQLMVDRSDKSVYLRSDGAVTMAQAVEVMDLLKGAGVENVAMVTRLPGER